MSKKLTIADLRHPFYTENIEDWLLWRRTYWGGQEFIDNYLVRLSSRENDTDYAYRKALTYCPAFAKEAIIEIKNSIYQRFCDITRDGGVKTYQDAIAGDLRGVDLVGSSMNSFIGQQVLPELLSMSRVGVYVDMPPLQGRSQLDKAKTRPYLYTYSVEQICSWCCDNSQDPNEFTQVLLQEEYDVFDEEYGLPMGAATRFRHMYKTDHGICCCFYNIDGERIDMYGEKGGEEIILDLPVIPFVLFKLDHSLLCDVAGYQKSLLNLASADMNYAIRANFPFYIEPYDPRLESPHLKPAAADSKGTQSEAQATTKENKIGPTQGRRYPAGVNPPEFIHPSPEPLKASMDKQAQLKKEIRELVQLAVSSLNPNKQASAESKSLDNQGLEAGLSYIGLELERGERRIAHFWSLYDGDKDNVATVNYPEKYGIQSDQERQATVKNLEDLRSKLPSKTLQKEVAKQEARILLANKVPIKVLQKIEQEIDRADYLTSDFEQVAKDKEMGLVSSDLASEARGYPKGEVEKAKKEHKERLAEIAKSQSKGLGAGAGARGVDDASSNPVSDGREEKAASRQSDKDSNPTDKTRGKGESQKGKVGE